jgi:hypothetical protein
MVIDQNGNVGIGLTSPTEKLEVNGKIKSPQLQITTGATNGYILTSDGSGNATWQTPLTSGTAWQLLGNSGTNPLTNFIGTIDSIPLIFKTKNTEE